MAKVQFEKVIGFNFSSNIKQDTSNTVKFLFDAILKVAVKLQYHYSVSFLKRKLLYTKFH